MPDPGVRSKSRSGVRPPRSLGESPIWPILPGLLGQGQPLVDIISVALFRRLGLEPNLR